VTSGGNNFEIIDAMQVLSVVLRLTIDCWMWSAAQIYERTQPVERDTATASVMATANNYYLLFIYLASVLTAVRW